jgi:ring-1,2-phenylacetyl-CoA epoxidase subunit PaaD
MALVKYHKEEILDLLQEVVDPEIPTISLIDLGVITEVLINTDNHVTVKMTPTFTGCPAMDYMRENVEEVLQENGISSFTVEMNFDSQWTSNNITEKGLLAIKKHGLAPPPRNELIVDIDILKKTECPFCGSSNSTLKSPFGPTLCRSLHYCNNCSQAFEQFKPV